jgi:hypothetical protein
VGGSLRIAALATIACGTVAGSMTASSATCCRWRHADRGFLPATYVISLAIDPARPRTMYAGTIWRGIAKSADGGAHWRPAGPFPLLADGKVPRPPDVMSLAVDPSRPGRVYAGTNFGGVLRSIDGGKTWRTANRGLPAAPYFPGARVFLPIVSLLVDPVAPRTVYAALAGTGVFVSRDGGGRWRRFAPGLTEPRVESLALAGRTLYAATAAGVYASDGGAWRPAGLREQWLEAVEVDRKRPLTIYAGSLKGGVFTSRDGGRSWRRSNRGLGNLYVRTLLADPRRAGRIYAGTYGGVFASSNSGRTWFALNDGLANRLVQALALGPGSTRRLFAGTLGAAVFAIDAP